MDWREIVEDNRPPQARTSNTTMNEIIG